MLRRPGRKRVQGLVEFGGVRFSGEGGSEVLKVVDVEIGELGPGEARLHLRGVIDAVTALAAVEVAGHIGATTIATTRTPAKKELLLKDGATHVIVTSEEDVVERTKAFTGGRGAELVFDAIAGEGVRKLAEATAEGGALVVYGALDAKEPRSRCGSRRRCGCSTPSPRR